VSTGTLVERAVVAIVGRGPIQLCSAAGGELIVALAGGGTAVTVLDGQTGAVLSTVEVGPSPWNAVANGSIVYVAMHTEPPAECVDAVQVVDCMAGRLVATIPLAAGSRPKIVVPALERQRLYCLNWGNGTVSEIGTDANTVMRSVEVGRGPQYGQRWQGALCIANGQSNDVAIVDESSFTLSGRVPVGRGPERCVVYRDRGQVYTNNLDDDTVSIVDLAAQAELARVDVGPGPIRITPWDSRGRAEWAVLCRGAAHGPSGTITFIDSGTHQVTETLGLPGSATNWNWGLGPHHQTVYVTLADEPLLLVVDAVHLKILETIRLSRLPEPAGCGPSIYVSKTGGVFVASQDSVTVLTQA
jgi:YVTN family beta-propeller protein